MKLLVSVTNETEAIEALNGGADIIDVKNPVEGALGASFPEVIRSIRRIIPSKVEVSATIGDLPNLPGTSSLAAVGAAACGVNYVKAGLFGVKSKPEALMLLKSICRNINAFKRNVKVIASGYADYLEINSINPLDVPYVASKAGASGVLIDMKTKNRKKIFDYLSSNELLSLVKKCHARGLTVALAGGLNEEDVPILLKLNVDIMGVRRSVCNDFSWLNSKIEKKKVMKLKETIYLIQKQAGK